jgi:hypothetical protein
MLRAYADEHVVFGLVQALRRRGMDVVRVFFWPQQRRSIGQLVRSIIREASRHDYDSACPRVLFCDVMSLR